MVVTGEQQHAAMTRGPRGVAVLQGVAAAIDARALGVPHRKDAVILGAGEEIAVGCPTPRWRRGPIDRGLEPDVIFFDKASCSPQCLIKTTGNGEPR